MTIAYIERIRELLDVVEVREAAPVRRAAQMVAHAVAAGGIVHVFGSGHSHMIADEGYARAGTLTVIKPIWPDKFTDTLEHVEGVAEPVAAKADLRHTDVIFVVSNSGRNPLPIEMAIAARSRGLGVIAITSQTEYAAEPSLHSSGKHLWDIADVVLDTHVPRGDAGLELPGFEAKVGPVSTILAVILFQAALTEAARALVATTGTAPVRISRNVGGAAHNARFRELFGHRIPGL